MPHPARTLTHDGLILTLQQWARKKGLKAETIRSRLDHQGWDVARALDTPTSREFARRGEPPIPAPRPCPKLTRHPDGRAWARWRAQGKLRVRYFGAWKSREAAEAYRRFAVEWASAGELREASDDWQVCELVAAYLDHVGRYYVKDGRQTSEVHAQRAAPHRRR